ncbi:MAG: lytic transglycosylase domain-containing protein [Albidovulum sp.]
MTLKTLCAAPMALAAFLFVAPAVHADDPAAFRAALAAADAKDWPVAMAQGRRAGPLAAAVIEWERLRDGKGGFDEYVRFVDRYADWPGLKLLREQAERVIAEDIAPSTVIDWFASDAPQTGTGSLALIAALPEKAVNSGGLAYDRFRWRIRKDLYDSAGALLLERSQSAEMLGDPAQWADWRRRLARKEMREGDAGRAYRMAARHHLQSGADYADLEWLAGYIALRKLGDAATALGHFDRFLKAVNGPISLARAHYWRGRAFEALGREADAAAAYAEGARYPTAFYGLLSAEKVGLPLSPAMAGGENYPDWRGMPFAESTVLLAARELMAAGDETLAARFLLHLAEGLSGYEIGALAGMAMQAKEPYVALSLAKAAADKGVIWPSAYFPVPALSGLDLPVRPELALSIARRESEFNASVVSHAGARGLMQVMPGTAKMMAQKIGVAYEPAKLTTDWTYNARLGAAYLDELVSEFGNSPLLVAAGYNAGPGRSRQWIAELGDPRAEGVDPVDWIEAIPFRETQTYVMRVAESLPIYRARLSGRAGPLRFTEELKGR